MIRFSVFLGPFLECFPVLFRRVQVSDREDEVNEMRFDKARVLTTLVALALLIGGSTAFAQGLPTATLTGRAVSEGQGLPGVSVTAKSPTLQGTRTSVTGATGEYVFANVPPGDYTVTFTLSGFQTVTRSIKLNATQRSQIDATMTLASVATTVTVVSTGEQVSQSSVEATTYTGTLLSALPTQRTIASAVNLSPGLNNNGANGVSIAGAQSTENLYMVNGVVITDNLRNTSTNLYIEDAVQETTTTTSAISAEYGRFVGGVINTVTKSGGNTFSGSLRSTFTNDSWNSTSAYRVPATGINPQEGKFIDKTTPTWEATFGGPILKDKIWFFAAGRYYDQTDALTGTTAYTGLTYAYGNKEPRYEGKLTITPFQNHTLTGSYINTETTQINNWYTSANIMDLASLYDRVLPTELLAFNYNGVLSESFFVEAQYSSKKVTFENSGSIYTDMIKGTLLLDTSRGSARYNSPTFCGVCTPEKRDNEDILLKGTYFLSTKGLGSHNIVVGYDDFTGKRLSNNHQSGSDYRVYGTGAVLQGSDIYPIFNTGTSTYFYFQPILEESQGSNVTVRSGFLNDTWRLNNNFSFNVGVRYDRNHAVDAGGAVTSTSSAFSPRLAATWDMKGDGKLRVTANYAKYVAGIQEGQAGSGYTPAGAPASYYWYYNGFGATPINTGAGPYLTSEQALNQLWSWFKAQGCLSDSNFMQPTTSACKVPQGGAPSVPGVNRQIRDSLNSPAAEEYTFGVAGTIGQKGSFRADVVRRTFGDFYDLKLDTTTGTVTNSVGTVFDLGLIVNSSDYRREYTGLHTQFNYRVGDRLNLGGNWTWSHLLGDIVGENSTSGTILATLHSQPEYFDRAWSAPVGSLSSDQRHRVRVYGTYDVPIPQSFGTLNFGAIQMWDTGTPFGAVGSVKTNTAAIVPNPGYKATPASVSYYFTARDAYRTEDIFRTDLSMTYSYKIGGAVELYITPQVFNVFNAQHIVSVNTTVNTAVQSTTNFNAFNPFTTAPVECPQTTTAKDCKALGANWQKGPLYGQPTGPTSYQSPRWFQFSVGVRF
jgi:hypothetical protein